MPRLTGTVPFGLDLPVGVSDENFDLRRHVRANLATLLQTRPPLLKTPSRLGLLASALPNVALTPLRLGRSAVTIAQRLAAVLTFSDGENLTRGHGKVDAVEHLDGAVLRPNVA